jgi:hypothetical protein
MTSDVCIIHTTAEKLYGGRLPTFIKNHSNRNFSDRKMFEKKLKKNLNSSIQDKNKRHGLSWFAIPTKSSTYFNTMNAFKLMFPAEIIW